MKRCKECGKSLPAKKGATVRQAGVPQRNNPARTTVRSGGQVNFACQMLNLCRRCYRERFPRRPMWNLPPLRQGSERLLSWDERRHLEAAGFNMTLWSEDFRREYLDYLDARMRGEVK